MRKFPRFLVSPTNFHLLESLLIWLRKLPFNFRSEKIYGFYMFGKPMLGITDVELVKAIKVKDFNHFVDVQDDHVSKTQRIGKPKF